MKNKKMTKLFDDGCGCTSIPLGLITKEHNGSLCGNCVRRLYSDWEELEESRNELLAAVIDLTNCSQPQHSYNYYFKIMQKAQVLKKVKEDNFLRSLTNKPQPPKSISLGEGQRPIKTLPPSTKESP